MATQFLKRHNDLTIRTPETTSIGRAASFNEENATLFYENLKTVRERYNFEAKDIYNVDETGCTTVDSGPLSQRSAHAEHYAQN